MKELADHAQRKRALTELDSTLLVEAAAGTGKTSLLAGRVLGLLANGVPPREIAAITFTEFAAGELRERVTRYLDRMLAGSVPDELRVAYPDGLTSAQQAALQDARIKFDELTCTTIHGFCHILLRTYAVEAVIDPGAEILDGPQADLLFRTTFDRWLRDRLERAEANDPIGHTAEQDPIHAERLLREFAEFRRSHRTARPTPSDIRPDDDAAFGEAVRGFRRWFDAVEGPPEAEQDIRDLEQLAQSYEGKFRPMPGFDQLWRLAHPPRVSIMRGKKLDLQAYRRIGIWRRAKGSTDGPRLAEEAGEHYEGCAAAFRALLGKVATAILAAFSAELDELLSRFETFKRNAAVLDFDDLLYVTRDVLRSHDGVRGAASNRFMRILVDEFQDTDPIQTEIVFLLASDGPPVARWQDLRLLPGRLFMVGDPKQAIYRFRGADIATYRTAREAVRSLSSESVIQVSSNFRSCGDILRHINVCFEAPLQGQETGYVALDPTREDAEHGLPCIAKVRVDVVPESRIDDIRDAEAQAVADVCARLIGNIRVRRGNGETVLLAPGDIALLAPIGAELWRYERALEEAGLPFSSQAGRNFFLRQEVQDLVALVRCIADVRDTVALGSLLRGPLIGLTEQQLLDLAEPLATLPNRTLNLRTETGVITHPRVREAFTILNELRLRIRSTSPSLLLAEAIERLNIRATLVNRSPDQASRMLANVDALLEMARAYAGRGFRQFARELSADWFRRRAHDEGVVDDDEHAIKIVTMHSSKGLEWPVVIPINTASGMRPPEQFVHRRSDDTMHWVLDDVAPPDLADAITTEAQAEAEQRLRVLYVACTRAMELLVLSDFSWTGSASWAQAVDLKLHTLPTLDISQFVRQDPVKPVEGVNEQTSARFDEEKEALGRSLARVRWVRPSDGDPDIVSLEAPSVTSWDDAQGPVLRLGGASRGVLLHKILEELITGELGGEFEVIRARSHVLCEAWAGEQDSSELSADELAQTAMRTWNLPEIAEYRAELIAELPVYGRINDDERVLVSGRADAVAYRNGRPIVVFDWKSDAIRNAATHAEYSNQIAQYARVIGAQRGAVVYMTSGRVEWVTLN